MRKLEFEVATHEEYGSLGFRPKWMPNADPLSGVAVAHDALEHFPDDDGSTEAELMALGASMYIRGDGTGYYGRTGHGSSNEKDHVGSEFVNIWSLHLNRDGRSRIAECPTRRMDADLNDRTRDIIAEGMKDIRDAYDLDTRPTAEDQKNMCYWLARGYYKARRRYAHVIGGQSSMTDLFIQIEERADRALKYAEEGMVLTVKINAKRCGVELSCAYPEEED